MILKYIRLIVCLLLLSTQAKAQLVEPARWQFSINEKSELLIKVALDKGWHLYDMNLPSGGPNSTEFKFEKIKGAELIGKVRSDTKVIKQYDPIFEMDLRWFENSAEFVQGFKLTNPDQFEISGIVDYMTCDDKSCIPATEEFRFTKKHIPAGIKTETTNVELATTSVDSTAVDSATTTPVIATQASSSTDYWNPVIDELRAFGSETTSSNHSWWFILITGFVGGLIALLTPCVWPMIPMTVSFFLKRSKKNRKKAIGDALTYGISIVVIYLALGLLITMIFGASALNELSTSAVFNLIFFALLVLFGISFLGAFELTLPSSWTTKLDSKADSTTGLLSIFFMAFTLVLVSFSCTGPIIGTLLVEAASMGSMTGPAIGMFGFALALSIPFALFAIFPSWLESMPKSGGWLNSVKVVLGFLELALALKFLSVADLAYGWRILDREVFLVLWIVLFILLGMYLIGKLKFSHDSDLKYVSIPRLFMAIVSFSFAMYMVPGLWGAPLKAISAFSPPLYTQDFNLYHGEVSPQFKEFEPGMEFAAKQKKPVLIDYTGFGCVNCREMEAAVWSDPRVKQIIDNDYVLISLYVDDKTKLPEEIVKEEFGKTRKLRTIGDKWSYLQRSKFGANAQPFYVLLDNHARPLSASYAYDKNIEKYIEFLKKGLEEYKKRNTATKENAQ